MNLESCTLGLGGVCESPWWLDKARALDTVKAPGYQLVGTTQSGQMMGVLGNLVAKGLWSRSLGHPKAWV